MYSKSEDIQSWDEQDIQLNKKFIDSQTTVDEALKDNFDTPTVMLTLSALITATNDYVTKQENRKVCLLRKIAAYVTKILKIFGVIEENDIGLNKVNKSGENDIKKEIFPYVVAITDFRTLIRENILNNGKREDILKYCDNLRDEIMPNFGVRISDDGDFPFDLMDRDLLLQDLKNEKIKKIMQNLSTIQKRYDTKLNDLDKQRGILASNVNEYMSKEYNITLTNDGGIPEKKNDGTKISKKPGQKLLKEKN